MKKVSECKVGDKLICCNFYDETIREYYKYEIKSINEDNRWFSIQYHNLWYTDDYFIIYDNKLFIPEENIDLLKIYTIGRKHGEENLQNKFKSLLNLHND